MRAAQLKVVAAFLDFARMKNIKVLPPSQVLLSGARKALDSPTLIEITGHFFFKSSLSAPHRKPEVGMIGHVSSAACCFLPVQLFQNETETVELPSSSVFPFFSTVKSDFSPGNY